MNPDLYAFVQEPGTSQPAPGGTEGGDQPVGCAGGQLGMLVPLMLMFVLMYFILIRPQRRQQKEREMMLSRVKKNDHVILQGGIYAIVDKVKDNELIVKVDEKNDVRLRVTRAAVAAVEKVASEEDDASEKK